jgi:hypothetical protein
MKLLMGLIATITLNTAASQHADTVLCKSAFGKADGMTTSVDIGREGGTVRSADGKLMIRIPADALRKKRKITIARIESTLPGSQGKAYHLLPEDVHFEKPVSLTFSYRADSNVNDALRGIAMQDNTGQWRDLRTTIVDSLQHTVSVKTTHFSRWIDYKRVVITPSSARVKVNKKLNLHINYYISEAKASNEDDLPPLSVVKVPVIPTWKVNGVINGNRVFGSVSTVNDLWTRVEYEAPSVVPDQNPVSVMANFTGLKLKLAEGYIQQLSVASDILVYDQSYEVKMFGWTDNSDAMCGMRMEDSGSFIVQLHGQQTRVVDIDNRMMQMPVRGSCKCSPVWTNEGSCIGPVHVAGLREVRYQPPQPPAKPYGKVSLRFTAVLAGFPTFRYVCGAGMPPPVPRMNAIPSFIEFETKPGEQVVVDSDFGRLGTRIIVRPLE